MLAAELDKIGANEASLVLRGNLKLFGDFNIKKFKNFVQNNGPDYVVKNLKGSNLTQAQKEDILDKYKSFKEHYDLFTDKYSKLPQESTIKDIKEIIINKAA
jgi:hypothetical protein